MFQRLAELAIEYMVRKRVRVVASYSNASAIRPLQLKLRHQHVNQPVDLFHMHAIYIENVGKKTARNVRIPHNTLNGVEFEVQNANYYVDPPKDARTSRADIVIPELVPEQQVQITYMYLPPMTFGQINFRPLHDDGFADVVPLIFVQKPPRFRVLGLQLLLALGAVTAIYILVRLGLYLYSVAKVAYPDIL